MDEPTSSTDAPVITDVRFDHIGLALRRPTDLWPVMAGALGGRYHGRGANAGYGWTQLRFANGFVVEGLNPEYHEGTDFLDRFLNRSGSRSPPPDLPRRRPGRGRGRAAGGGHRPRR